MVAATVEGAQGGSAAKKGIVEDDKQQAKSAARNQLPSSSKCLKGGSGNNMLVGNHSGRKLLRMPGSQDSSPAKRKADDEPEIKLARFSGDNGAFAEEEAVATVASSASSSSSASSLHWSSASSTASSRSPTSSPQSEDFSAANAKPDPVKSPEVAGTGGVDDPSTYRCELCQKRFPFMEFLRHQESHKDDLPYTCAGPSCGHLRFRTQSEVKAHRRQAHKTLSTSSSPSSAVVGLAPQPQPLVTQQGGGGGGGGGGGSVVTGSQSQSQLATATFFRSSTGSYICPHCKQVSMTKVIYERFYAKQIYTHTRTEWR